MTDSSANHFRQLVKSSPYLSRNPEGPVYLVLPMISGTKPTFDEPTESSSSQRAASRHKVQKLAVQKIFLRARILAVIVPVRVCPDLHNWIVCAVHGSWIGHEYTFTDTTTRA